MSKLYDLIDRIISRVNASVKIDAQNLNDDQKKQARSNIEAQEKLSGEQDQMLVFGEDGNIAPLKIGTGLCIIDGTLYGLTPAICGEAICGQTICGVY